MACDMPEPCQLLSLDSCLKRFLWTHEEVAPLIYMEMDRRKVLEEKKNRGLKTEAVLSGWSLISFFFLSEIP